MLGAKGIFCLLFILCFAFSLLSQSKLDSLYALASVQSFGCVLVPQDDGFIIIGHGTNDNPFNSYGTLFTKLDLEGNIQLSTYTLDSNKLHLYYDMNAIVIDTFLYTTFGGTAPYQLLKFNTNNGQIEARKTLANHLVKDSYYDSYSLTFIDAQTILVNGMIFDENQKWITQLSVYHIDLDNFSYHYNSFLNWNQVITKVIKTSDGYVLTGYIRSGNPNNIDYVSKAVIVWLDDHFAEKGRFISASGDLQGLGYDVILNEEKSAIATNCVGHHIDPGFGHGIVVQVWRPSIYSVDSLGNLDWQTEMGYPHFGEVDCIFHSLIESNSKDGYIAVGAQTNFSGQEYYSTSDTLNEQGELFRFEALIAKVSTDGDSLWSRHLYTSNFLYSSAEFYDIIPRPEGGYVLTGSANKHPLLPGTTASYTWLVSIDEFGCIVPGCNEIVSADEIDMPIQIKLYPNPTEDLLYIYQQENENMFYSVVNSSGEVFEKFQMKFPGSTFMLNVSNYTPGIYNVVKADTLGRITTQEWLKI